MYKTFFLHSFLCEIQHMKEIKLSVYIFCFIYIERKHRKPLYINIKKLNKMNQIKIIELGFTVNM